jgi:hypothetical protein
MADHARSVEDVLGTFEGELKRLSDRAEQIKQGTVKAFADAHAAFDHAEYINDVVGKAASRLSRFLGPPPNTIAMPRQEIEDAHVVAEIPGNTGHSSDYPATGRASMGFTAGGRS